MGLPPHGTSLPLDKPLHSTGTGSGQEDKQRHSQPLAGHVHCREGGRLGQVREGPPLLAKEAT